MARDCLRIGLRIGLRVGLGLRLGLKLDNLEKIGFVLEFLSDML